MPAYPPPWSFASLALARSAISHIYVDARPKAKHRKPRQDPLFVSLVDSYFFAFFFSFAVMFTSTGVDAGLVLLFGVYVFCCRSQDVAVVVLRALCRARCVGPLREERFFMMSLLFELQSVLLSVSASCVCACVRRVSVRACVQTAVSRTVVKEEDLPANLHEEADLYRRELVGGFVARVLFEIPARSFKSVLQFA